ncbi:MAG: hypothetical protein J0G30_05105 [Actinomycetales bacterium]|nr:hypothetical protein [Actinomycetales bacterium]
MSRVQAVVAAVSAVGAAGLALLLAALVILFSRPDADRSCTGRPVPPGLPAGTVPETVEIHGGLSWLPFGLECRYSGSGVTVVAPVDPTGTALVALAVALVLAAVLISAAPVGSGRRRAAGQAGRSRSDLDDGRPG